MGYEELAARAQELQKAAESGTLSKASRAKLEEYSAWLCQPAMATHFGGGAFTQISESVRAQHLRALVDDFEKRSNVTQRLVIALAIASLVASAIQVWVAVRPDDFRWAQSKAAPADTSAMGALRRMLCQ